jgi:hypothetical protein
MIVEIIQQVFPKCSKLDIKDQTELLQIMWALSIITPKKIQERIFDLTFDEDNFIDFISKIKMFGLDSKGDIRKLIRNNGLKVNNSIVKERLTEIEWIKLGAVEFAIVRKGKNDFDFVFNEFKLSSDL